MVLNQEKKPKYISKVLTRITFVGTISLLLIALLPVILSLTNAVPASLSLGWTGLIIVVDVSLEVNNQINGILSGNGFVKVNYRRKKCQKRILF